MFSYSYRNTSDSELEIWEDEKLKSAGLVFPRYFEFSQNFHECLYNVWAWTQEKNISISFIK